MTAFKTYVQPSIRALFLLSGIVLSAVLSSCGAGGASTTTATDGTTITAGQPDVSFIYISTTAGTNKRASLNFSISKKGQPVANVNVTATLNEQALLAGVTFFGGATTLNLTTDTNGNTATFSVVSGSIPTSVIVKGALTGNSLVADYASAITVSSGAAVQDRFSMGLATLSIEGWDYLGETTTATVQLADRLGNPVPNGTSVNFSTSPGLIVTPTSCTTSASSCTVNLISDNSAGRKPFVTILAFTEGEEAFTDSNSNNKYDAGEAFSDLGKPYRDDNQNGTYDVGIDQALSAVGTGSLACPQTPANSELSVPNTCNGVRDANAIVRISSVLYLAPSNLNLSQISSSPSTYIYELFGTISGSSTKYRAPSGTSVTASVTPSLNNTSNCQVSIDNFRIESNFVNATQPTIHTLTYTRNLCSGQQADITVATAKRSFKITVPL